MGRSGLRNGLKRPLQGVLEMTRYKTKYYKKCKNITNHDENEARLDDRSIFSKSGSSLMKIIAIKHGPRAMSHSVSPATEVTHIL